MYRLYVPTVVRDSGQIVATGVVDQKHPVAVFWGWGGKWGGVGGT